MEQASSSSSSSLWGGLNSGIVLSLLAVAWTMLWQALQALELHQFFSRHTRRLTRRLAAFLDPDLTVTIAEYDGGRMRRSDAYKEAKAYLERATREGTSSSSSSGGGAAVAAVRHLKAEPGKDPDRLLLSMADDEEIADEFRGAVVTWRACSAPQREDSSPAAYFWGGRGGAARAERRSYQLVFSDRHRDLVLGEYLTHVRRQGRAAMVKNRQRKLFTNLSGDGSWDSDGVWSHVVFEHPKTFATLAMDPARKKEIMDDLDAFRNGKDYYARVGRAWKRGYLLYGPPGTGKSTMIAAMANHLDYDVYDIELTSVRTNTDLRKLFIETTGKSIIVIEDIDCSLDLTGKRRKKKNKKKNKDKKDEEDKDKKDEDDDDEEEEDGKGGSSKVTLSGVLNFIDGLWSACGGERIVVFTTNHVEKLDPALIRRGRMDKHIEMSYCGFEAFKFLAKVYLDVDEHPRFGEVAALLGKVEMTPADVAENMTPKGPGDDADSCLDALVEALEKAKEEAMLLAKKKKKKEEEDKGKKKQDKGEKKEASDDADDDEVDDDDDSDEEE